MTVQRTRKSRFTKFLVSALMASHLVSCGGGGSSTDASQVSASAVTIAWDAPVARADESPLSPAEIGGYRVYYGTEEGIYPNRIDVADGTALQVVVTDLPPGTFYFVVTTYDNIGRESEYSPVVTATAPS